MIKMLKEALTKECYQDIRLECQENTIIQCTNGKVDSVSCVKKSGGLARAFAGGGFAAHSFSDIEKIGDAVKKVTENALLIKGDVKLAETEVCKDNTFYKLKSDPRNFSLGDKIELMNKYSEIAKTVDKIVSVRVMYIEQTIKKYFVSSEGAEIEQEVVHVGIPMFITAKYGDDVQTAMALLGGNGEYEHILNQEEYVIEEAKRAANLLDAKSVESGIYDVVLSNELAGMFIHESFGHFSEADLVMGSKNLIETLSFGTKFSVDELSVYDDPNILNSPGYYEYDDEGVKSKKSYLIEKGVLKGRLHSRYTAGLMGEKATGHSRSVGYDFNNLVRMGNICIENGSHDFDEMIKDIDNGLYLFGLAGGQTTGNEFTLNAQSGYLIENGKLTDLIRGVSVSGELYSTLKNIRMIGNDFKICQVGACGKGKQSMKKSGSGAPTISVKNMAIGGK